MQNISFKILILFFFLGLPIYQQAQAQDHFHKLALADSLFEQKKYSESFQIFENILIQSTQYSPGMLLKMAFIKEGLGDYSQALYYLNLYYLKTANKETLNKMKELASKHDLQGYEFSDLEYLQGLAIRYFTPISVLIITLMISLLGYIFLKKQKTLHTSWSSFVLFILLTISLLTLNNYISHYNKGLVINHNSYLMSGPSAGADMVTILKKGHRLDILGKNDTWIKVRWENQHAYIRDSQIKPVLH
jgi:tetratricopeptide (TPR) repeat protein